MEGSILDAPLLERLFEQYKFDYVYHLAAYAAEGLSHFIRRFNFTNNVGAQVGYRSFDVLYKVEQDEGNLQLKGLYFGGVVRF